MGAWLHFKSLHPNPKSLHPKRDADIGDANTGKLPLAAATAAVELHSQTLVDVAGTERT